MNKTCFFSLIFDIKATNYILMVTCNHLEGLSNNFQTKAPALLLQFTALKYYITENKQNDKTNKYL